MYIPGYGMMDDSPASNSPRLFAPNIGEQYVQGMAARQGMQDNATRSQMLQTENLTAQLNLKQAQDTRNVNDAIYSGDPDRIAQAQKEHPALYQQLNTQKSDQDMVYALHGLQAASMANQQFAGEIYATHSYSDAVSKMPGWQKKYGAFGQFDPNILPDMSKIKNQNDWDNYRAVAVLKFMNGGKALDALTKAGLEVRAANASGDQDQIKLANANYQALMSQYQKNTEKQDLDIQKDKLEIQAEQQKLTDGDKITAPTGDLDKGTGELGQAKKLVIGKFGAQDISDADATTIAGNAVKIMKSKKVSYPQAVDEASRFYQLDKHTFSSDMVVPMQAATNSKTGVTAYLKDGKWQTYNNGSWAPVQGGQ